MPQPSVEANVFILDINPSSGEYTENGKTFLSEAINCMMRVVERKIFSRPNDLLSLVLLGSEESNNKMYQEGDKAFQNISIATTLSKPTWDLIDLLNNKLKISNSEGDWIDALIVAADYLISALDESGIKTLCKKIVLMTDFKTKTTVELDQLQQIVNGFNSKNIDLIFIGSSILNDDNEEEEEDTPRKQFLTEEQEFNLRILSNISEELDAIKCTFDEANLQLKFHKRKTANLCPWNVDLSIGNHIKIPISAFGRIRNEPPVKICWSKVVSQNITEHKAGYDSNKLIAVETKRIFSKADDNMDTISKENIIDGYTYGDKTIPFTEFDTSMNYKSGERGLICYGFAKREQVNCSHLSDNGITFVTGRKDNQNSFLAVEALASSLKQNGFVLIARKVYNKGSAPRMVALFPIIKKSHKCLSMIALAFREDHRHMLLPGLNQKKYMPDEEQLNAVEDLINAMDLSRLDDDGKPVFSIEANINPVLQYTYDSLAYRAMNPKKPLAGPRPEVQKLLEVPISVVKLAVEPLEKIKELFPLVAIEKTSGKKEWIDKHLSAKENKEEINNKIFNPDNVTATAVLVNKIAKVGTTNPADDFKEISKTDFTTACEQMKEVIESLVIYYSSEDYSKPMSALKEMRLTCNKHNPAMYNDWLIKLKDTLLDRFKGNFLKELFENKLGLITKEENSSSLFTETSAKDFENITVNDSISKPTPMDDMSDLF